MSWFTKTFAVLTVVPGLGGLLETVPVTPDGEPPAAEAVVETIRSGTPDRAFLEELSRLPHDPCSVDCGSGCEDPEQHHADPGDTDEWDGGTHDLTNCRDKVCDWLDPGNGKHPWCGGPDQDEEEQLLVMAGFRMMEAAVDGDDVAMMADLVRAAPQKFRVDEELAVVKFSPCGERVVAQYEIPRGRLAVLVAVREAALAN